MKKKIGVYCYGCEHWIAQGPRREDCTCETAPPKMFLFKEWTAEIPKLSDGSVDFDRIDL